MRCHPERRGEGREPRSRRISICKVASLEGKRCAHGGARAGFTLLEILMAATAAALIFAAIYGVFSRAVKLRDDATARTRLAQVRARAAAVIRDDLRHGFVSTAGLDGTVAALANILEGSAQGGESSFPGYLSFTTTTAIGSNEEEFPSDLHTVEYYIADDAAAARGRGGVLVRTVDRDLLAPLRQPTGEERLLPGLESMEVSFFDGQSWVDSWTVADSAGATLPQAVRVRLQPVAAVDAKDRTQLPIEILVPWSAQTGAN